MPTNPENLEPDVVSEFEDWLNEKAVISPGLTVYDLDMMQIVILIRLRSVFTIGELHTRAHAILEGTEHFLAQPGSMVDTDGQPMDPMLRENFGGTQEELSEMLQAMMITAQDMDRSLEALFNEGDKN